MPSHHLTATNVTTTDAGDEINYRIDEINAYLDSPDNSHNLYPIFEHIAAILSEIPAEGLEPFNTALTTRPLVQSFFRSDYDGHPHMDEGIVLSLHLDIGTDITVEVDSPGEMLRRGGWDGGSVTLHHVLSGVAGMLSDATQSVLDAFLRAGTASDPETTLSLSEAMGGASTVREEAEYSEEFTDEQCAKIKELSDEDIDAAIKVVVESGLGDQIADRIDETVDRKIMEVLTDLMSDEVGLARSAALRVALGEEVDLGMQPLSWS